MSWKRKVQGGTMALIGYLLSPLSWWNDLVVNVPLAIAFGWLVSLVYAAAFEPAVVVGYWLTNVLGFWLLQRGARHALSHSPLKPYSWRSFARDLAISLAYTLLIVILLKQEILRPLAAYFPSR